MRGADKLLQRVAGQPLLRHVASIAKATGSEVWVTLPADAKARQTALTGLGVRVVPVPDATLGMSRSLYHGITAIRAKAGPDDGVMILPADMPDFTAEALGTLIARFQAEPNLIFRGATPDGQFGHPALFPGEIWPELAVVTGDQGGKTVLERHKDKVRIVALPGRMALIDLDTPEDWAAWQAGDP